MNGIIKGLKDCWKIVFYEVILTIFFIILYVIFLKLIFGIIGILLAGFIIFTFYFFRNPYRNIPQNNNIILAPADGKILEITTVNENTYVKKKCYRINIFMNIFNVHRNRIPYTGIVEKIIHIPGKLRAAFKEVEDSNERTIIYLKGKENKILFKQIAGLIARRIICKLKPGVKVKAGEEFGMIAFGSSVIIYIPVKEFELIVSEKDKVYAGISILAQKQMKKRR